MPPRKKADTKPVETQPAETREEFVFNEKLALITLVKALRRRGLIDSAEFDRVINELG